MNHAMLVALAARWLRSRRLCHVVLTEARALGNFEHPDAIGWSKDGGSIVVEAKSNRADFRDDWRPDRKAFRRDPSMGMGNARYYIAPPGVISVADAAQRGWGLVVAYPNELRTVRASPFYERNTEAELRLIARVARNAEDAPEQLVIDFHRRS